ncbi:hypothetical protein T07_14702 [Trichinella nelsoni]|uniref:Uncharacterized protein n=1 Tax=Trichinella nelsoni TaxID=6336 RepID=A0A0V0S9V2_9BILA|nr:hypothetical protein T07_14702 [Trichinella nelsoni]
MRSHGCDILTGPPLHRFYRKKHVCTCSSTWGYGRRINVDTISVVGGGTLLVGRGVVYKLDWRLLCAYINKGSLLISVDSDYMELLTIQHVLHSQFGGPDSASSRPSADPLLRACSSEVVLYRIYQASLASKLSHFLDVQLNRLVASTLAQTMEAHNQLQWGFLMAVSAQQSLLQFFEGVASCLL